MAKLVELLEKIIGGGTPSKNENKYWNGNIPWASVKDIGENQVYLSYTQDSITKEGLAKSSSNLIPEGNVIIPTRMGLGRCVINKIDTAINQDLKALIPKKDKLNNKYLLYWLKFNAALIESMGSGTTVKGIRLEQLTELELNDIDIKIQQKIARILSNYDDLIENNNRRIKILEEMAQKIYKEWFVDFKFPGHETTTFKDSPLGKIPNDWEVLRLADIANITMGQSPKSEFYNENKKGLPFHQGVTNFGIRYPLNKIYCSCNGRIANSNDILLSVRAPVGRINITKDKMLIGRGLAAINSKNNNQTFLFYLLSKLFINEDQFGNGAVFNAITKEELSSLEVMYPSNKLITSFETIVKSLDILLMNLLHKNENLKQTRDILLPRLISGEIDVENMEVL